jgi:hypothetical protein
MASQQRDRQSGSTSAETRDNTVADRAVYGQLTGAENYNAGREATAARAEGLARAIEAVGRFFGRK